MPRFSLPVLAPAEKSALAILLALLASGALLRAWENSGVSLGPVDDWEGLRALVVRARARDAAPWPCAMPAGFDERSGGAKKGSKKEGARGKAKAAKPVPAVVDLNKAGEKQLDALPGVGPSTARAIVAWRAAHGAFAAPEDLMRVKGIGPRKFEALRPWVRVSGVKRQAPPDSSEVPDAPAPTTPPDAVPGPSNAVPERS